MRQAVIESGRAEFALDAVNGVIKNYRNNAKEYKSYVRKFPSLVLTNGFAAAVAFVLEKKKKENEEKNAYNLIYDNISNWLETNKFYENKELKEYIFSLDSNEYRVVTNEILALFEWLRRFASGLIEGDAE